MYTIVGKHTTNIKIHFLNFFVLLEATPWSGQDPTDLDKPMHTLICRMFGQVSKTYINPILTVQQSVLTQGQRKQELPITQTI